MTVKPLTVKPLESWNSDATRATFHTNLYHTVFDGRTMQKSADDLDRYTEIIGATQPDVVVETGCRYGGSALWFHRIFGVEVISVDIAFQLPTRHSYDAHPGIKYLESSSIDPGVIVRIRELTEGKRVMVSLDSDHHANHVWQEIQMYGQLVTPGCHLVVEDACFDMWTGEDSRRGGRRIPEEGGPLKAINLAGLDVDPRFRRDVQTEELTDISHSPCGWWQRNA